MKRYKLGLGNKTVLEQIAICRRVSDGINNLSSSQRAALARHPVAESVDAAARAHLEVGRLKVVLKTAVAHCRNAVRKMRDQTASAASHLMALTAGEPAALLASGLDVAKDRQSIGVPGAPRLVRPIGTDYEGTVRLRWKRPVRRCVFIVQISRDQKMQNWTTVGHCVRQTHDIRKLPGGKKIWFRVAAVNTHGQGPWSNPICAWAK
jgi:hypothetical protein